MYIKICLYLSIFFAANRKRFQWDHYVGGIMFFYIYDWTK